MRFNDMEGLNQIFKLKKNIYLEGSLNNLDKAVKFKIKVVNTQWLEA